MATAPNKGTLLYGNMDSDNSDSAAASMFIDKLLIAVNLIHRAHLMTTGPGSFAAHEALGEVYDNLTEDLDRVAEVYMGCQKAALSFDDVDMTTYGAEAWKIYYYIEANRMMMGAETHIQAAIDDLLNNLARDLFKLDRLA
jgi:DNA-binding ferritin-like protein